MCHAQWHIFLWFGGMAQTRERMTERFMYGTLARLLAAGAVCLAAAACGDDLPDRPGEGLPAANVNANRPDVPEASRMEMPRLAGGAYTQFIVKKARLRDSGGEEFVNFCMEYDQRKRASRWTAFRWDIDNVYDSKCGRAGNFTADSDVPAQYRLGNGTFRGYQRGHMLASEDRQCSVSANRQTFCMTNIHPQLARFNGFDSEGSYVWCNAEMLVRKLYKGWTRAANATDTIYVVKGGTMDGTDMIAGYTDNGSTYGIIVPKYFYMALLYKTGRSQTQGGYKAIALWFAHREGDTTSGKDIARRYAISIDELERRTGMDFFCNLPDEIEDVVERDFNLAAWGWE